MGHAAEQKATSNWTFDGNVSTLFSKSFSTLKLLQVLKNKRELSPSTFQDLSKSLRLNHYEPPTRVGHDDEELCQLDGSITL